MELITIAIFANLVNAAIARTVISCGCDPVPERWRIQRAFSRRTNHQGKGNKLLFPEAADKTEESGHVVECRHELRPCLSTLLAPHEFFDHTAEIDLGYSEPPASPLESYEITFSLDRGKRGGDNSIMAEREGFEPSIEFPLYTLSKRAPSTTRPSLRLVGLVPV